MSDLRELAEKAKGDPWHEGIAGSGPRASNIVAFGGDDIVGVGHVVNADRRAYIVAAQPTVILALLDENAKLKALLAECVAAYIEPYGNGLSLRLDQAIKAAQAELQR